MLKKIGRALGALVGLVVVAVVVLYFVAGAKMSETHEVAIRPIDVVADSASLAEGERLSIVHGCTDCHGQNFGGGILIDAPPFLVVAPNLTAGAGGVGGDYMAGDWQRALRHGLGYDGRSLLSFMPSEYYARISDQELSHMIAYLSSLPPVDQELPPSELRLIGRILTATGGLPLAYDQIDHDRVGQPAPAPGVTVAYGAYLASTGCVACHGAELKGGAHPDPSGPPGPSLEAAATWPQDVFKAAMRTGVRPSGVALDPKWMPWPSFSRMTDMELEALHAHLQDALTP